MENCELFWRKLFLSFCKRYGKKIEFLERHRPTSKESDEVMNWISVKDKLPGKEEVLIYVDKILIIGYFNVKSGWSYIDGGDWCELKNVTYWMPLPKPPKE